LSAVDRAEQIIATAGSISWRPAEIEAVLYALLRRGDLTWRAIAVADRLITLLRVINTQGSAVPSHGPEAKLLTDLVTRARLQRNIEQPTDRFCLIGYPILLPAPAIDRAQHFVGNGHRRKPCAAKVAAPP
jgi:hypothetical protein